MTRLRIAALVSLLFLLVGSVPAFGQWPSNGISVSSGLIDGSSHGVASDGMNGFIVAWGGQPSLGSLVAKRFDASGTELWNVTVRSAFARDVVTAPDGFGGAYIVWREYNSSTDYNIMANRVSKTGALSWSSPGLVVCNASGIQHLPAITTDNANGLIIAWEDQRSDAGNVYAQRLTTAGSLAWTANGAAICTASGQQGAPVIAADGSGGGLISWNDGLSNTNISAQRVNGSGSTQWTTNGVPVCNAADFQFVSGIVGDGSGGAWILWDDARNGGTNYDVFIQHLNSSGSALLTSNGVAAASGAGNQWESRLVTDGAGGAVAVWQNGSLSQNANILLTRVFSNGFVNAPSGICVASGDQIQPRVSSDGAGNCLITWNDRRTSVSEVYGIRVDASGAYGPGWITNGVAIATGSIFRSRPLVISDLQGGMFVAWEEDLGSTNAIRAARVTSAVQVNPAEGWASDGAIVGRGSGIAEKAAIVRDPSGGTYAGWSDTRTGAGDIYLQHLNEAGFVHDDWPVNGLNVSAVSGLQQNPVLVADANGVTAAWEDFRNGNWDVYAQTVSRNGRTLTFAANGLAVCTNGAEQWDIDAITDGAGNYFFAWEDRRLGGTSWDVYAQRVMSAGAQWTANGVRISSLAQQDLDPSLVLDGAGGVLIGWGNLSSGIYAARVNSASSILWTASVSSDVYDFSYQLCATTDGSGGAYIAWVNYLGLLQKDARMRRISGSGTFPSGWSSPITVLGGSVSGLRIDSDAQGGAVLAAGTGSNLYGVRRLPDGTSASGWPRLVTTQGNSFGASGDGTGGLLVAWGQGSGTSANIYSHRIRPSGDLDPNIPSGGALLCGAVGEQISPSIVRQASEVAIVAWRDAREGTSNAIYAGRLTYHDVTPPAAVTDLHANFGRYNAAVFWTDSGDDGVVGSAQYYELRRSSSPIDEGSWMGAVVAASGTPGAGGSGDCTELTLPACSGHHFAVKFRDEAGNWSPISNPTSGSTMCSGYQWAVCDWMSARPPRREIDAPLQVELALAPNPFRSDGVISYGIPAHLDREKIELAIFDLTGRRVRTLLSSTARPGRFETRWDLRREGGPPVNAGVFFLRLKVGPETWTKSVVVAR